MLFDYWKSNPPDHEILAMLARVYTTWQPESRPMSEAEQRASLEARWKAGAMNAKQIFEAMGGALSLDGQRRYADECREDARHRAIPRSASIMAELNLSVTITANVVDLQAKLAVAQANLRSFNAELNSAARASIAAGAGMDAGLKTQLTQAAEGALKARSAVNTLTGELNGVAGSAGVGVHGIREVNTAIRELASGDVTRLPGTFALLAHHFGGLNIGGVAAAAGIVALAGGLAYLAVKAIEASNAIDKIKIGADFAGNIDLTRAQIQAFADQLSSAANVSNSDAEQIVAGFARMRNASAPEIQALSALVSDMAMAEGVSATKAGEELAKAFDDPIAHGKEFVDSLKGVTQAQKDNVSAALQTGDANKVVAAMIAAVTAATQRAAPEIDKYNSSMTASIKNFMLYAGMAMAGVEPGQAETYMLQAQNEAREKNNQLLKEGAAATAALPPTPEQTEQLGVAVAEKENPVAKQAEEARTKIAEMTAALEVAKSAGDTVNVKLLTASLAEAKEKLDALNFGPVVDRMRTDMATLASTWDGTQSGLFAKQQEIAAQALSQTTKGSQQYLAIVQEEARLGLQIRNSAGTEAIAAARVQISAINAETNLGNVQKLDQERSGLAGSARGDSLTYAQRVEAQRSFNDATASLEKAQVAQAQEIAKSDADTDAAIARLKIEAEKSALDQELQLNQISAGQKLTILKQLTDDEYAIDLNGLNKQLALLADQPVEYEKVYNQIRELKAKEVADLNALDLQAANDAKKAASQQVSAWKGAIDEVTSAESSFLSDYLTGRKTASQSVITLADQTALKEIQADAGYYSKKLLYALLGVQADASEAQGGFLVHALAETQKTAATTAGVAHRTTVEQAGNSSFIGQIGQSLAKWLGFETSKTAATTAGTAQRTATATTADTASLSEQVALGFAEIEVQASIAAASAFADSAMAGPAGLIAAPAAAATAYSTTMGFAAGMGGGVALDVGAWNIPGTMQATLHAGEAVVPADFASGLRASGSLGGGGKTYGDTHFHGPLVHVAGSNASPDSIARALSSAMRNFHPALKMA